MNSLTVFAIRWNRINIANIIGVFDAVFVLKFMEYCQTHRPRYRSDLTFEEFILAMGPNEYEGYIKDMVSAFN